MMTHTAFELILIMIYPFRWASKIVPLLYPDITSSSSFIWIAQENWLLAYGLWHIWSQTHMVPRHLVPHNGSPNDWSLWTNSPQPIQSPWIIGPPKFGPLEHMVPNQFGPLRQMVPWIFRLSRGTGWGDTEFMGPNWLGTICPGDQIFGGSFV